MSAVERAKAAAFPVPRLEVLALNAILIWDRELGEHLFHGRRREALPRPGPERFPMPHRYRGTREELPLYGAHRHYCLTFSRPYAHGLACQHRSCARLGVRRLGLGRLPFLLRYLALDPLQPAGGELLIWRCNPQQISSACRREADAWRLDMPESVYQT